MNPFKYCHRKKEVKRTIGKKNTGIVIVLVWRSLDFGVVEALYGLLLHGVADDLVRAFLVSWWALAIEQHRYFQVGAKGFEKVIGRKGGFIFCKNTFYYNLQNTRSRKHITMIIQRTAIGNARNVHYIIMLN